MRRKDCRTVVGRRIQCSAQAPPPAWPGSAFPEPGRRTWDGPKPISIVGSTGSIGTQVWRRSLSFFLVSLLRFKIKCKTPDKFWEFASVGYNRSLMCLQTLDIVAENPDKFRVVALAAGSNVTLLVDRVIHQMDSIS